MSDLDTVIEGLLDQLDHKDKRIAELELLVAAVKKGPAQQRIAELEGLLNDNTSLRNLIQKQFIELREDKDKRIAELEEEIEVLCNPKHDSYATMLQHTQARIAELEDALRDLVDRRYLECVTEMPCGDCACCRAKAVLKAVKP